MAEITLEQQVDEIFADLDARNILYPEPVDLPPAAALVRLPGGMIGEVVLWFDRNPQGTLWFSGQRVVLVELVDSVLDRASTSSVEHRRAFTEEAITVLRAVPTEAARQRWLARWKLLRPDSFAQKLQARLISEVYAYQRTGTKTPQTGRAGAS